MPVRRRAQARPKRVPEVARHTPFFLNFVTSPPKKIGRLPELMFSIAQSGTRYSVLIGGLMRVLWGLLLASLLSGQTAEELVQRNLAAKGGIDKLKSIKTLRMTGRMQMGSMTAQVGEDAMAPDLLRQNFTLQGMTAVQAYDGKTGWKISPFEGRRDPELAGEQELRDLVEDADFYGPLVDYQAHQ